MNPETAFVRDRGMSLSEYEWVMVETALYAYANHIAASEPNLHQVRIARDAIALAKAIRITEDHRNARRAFDDALDSLADDIDSFYSN